MKQTWWMGVLSGGVLGAVALTAVTGLYASGQGGAGAGRIACIDVVKIFNEYLRQKDLTDQLDARQREMQAEAEQRRNRIDSLQATIDAMSLNDPMYVKKTREMFQLQLDYKNWSDMMQAETAREVGIWTRKMYSELLEVTSQFAEQEGYDVVLYTSPPELVSFDPDAVKEQIRSRKVVYASDSVDISLAVLDRMNANYRALPKTQMLQIGP